MKKPATPEGQLGAVFTEAMRIWDAQKAEGVPQAERIAGLRETLKAAWPQTREWKYLCQSCSDYGLVMNTCPGVKDAICGRSNPHQAHEFGTPCWCDAGRRFRPKKASAEDAVDDAARVRTPTKLGRF